MHAFVVLGALLLWSAFVLVLVCVDPGGGLLITACGRMIEPLPPGCDAVLAAVADASWRYHELPSRLAITSGYAAISLIELIRWRRRRRWHE